MLFRLKKRDGTIITKDGTIDGIFLRWDGLGFIRFDIAGKKIKLFVQHRETEPPDPAFPPPAPDDPQPDSDEWND